MISEKIKENFDRIDLAKEFYDKEYNRLKRLEYYIFLGFSLPYMFMFIIAFYNPLKLLIEKVQYLDIISTAFFVIMMFYFMYKASKTSDKRKKLKSLIGLSVEEELFYNIYNTWNIIILYKYEVNRNRKDNLMTDIIISLNDIKNVLNKWTVGNISYLNKLYGDKFQRIKNDFKNLDMTEIKKGDMTTMDKLHNYLIQFNEYLCDSNDVRLNNVIFNIDNLPLKPKVTKDKQLGYIDLLYTQPKMFSFLISLIISSIFLMITLNYNLGMGAILTIVPTTLGISFQISYTLLKEPKEKEEMMKTEITPDASVMTDDLKGTKENILFTDYFEYETHEDFLKNWNITVKNEGKIFVTDKIKGVSGTNKCMKIHHPVDSQAFVKRTFKESQKVFIKYFIRQESYDERGRGSPFIVESPSRVNLNGGLDDRPVYMDILYRKLRCGGNPKNPQEICEIEIKKWYLITLEVDCINHFFVCSVDDYSIEGKINDSYNKVSALRTKYWGKNAEWTTYIDVVQVYKLD